MLKRSVLFLFIIGTCFAQQGMISDFSNGFLAMSGGRYDNVRMCVGSPAEVPGGPMADVMFSVKYHVRQNRMITFNCPVMRPLLFGIALKMLQFEPEILMEYHRRGTGRDLYWGPGLGLSFNSSPGIDSDLENRGANFFSFGPIVSVQGGVEVLHHSYLSVKTFYSPLFRYGGDNGYVAGAAVQFAKYF